MPAENCHPGVRSRSQCRTSPACDSVNAMNTPIVYSGMSPFTLEAMNNMGLAMKTPQLRFWAIEHPTGMFAAFIILRIGRVLAANFPAHELGLLTCTAGECTVRLLPPLVTTREELALGIDVLEQVL